MNKVLLLGRVTQDIELKATASGTEVADFTLAVNRNYKNAEGNYEADFINCVSYKGLAKTISTYVKKGDRLAVEGRLQTRTYQNKEGKNVKVSEVIVENIDFIETKKKEHEKVGIVGPYDGMEKVEVSGGSFKGEQIDAIPVPNDPFTEQMTIAADDMDLPF
jgi:single-strand DNA-binding protein